jgi:hypothetical protein
LQLKVAGMVLQSTVHFSSQVFVQVVVASSVHIVEHVVV